VESKEAIYKIFASHGNMDDLVYFAEVMKDYPQIIMHYLQEENHRKALEALAKQVICSKSVTYIFLSCNFLF
jgi:vacuolar protein sorting-associated protein 18